MDELPSPILVFKAIDVYLRHAYNDGAPPSAVRARLEALAGLGEPASFYASDKLEHDAAVPPQQYQLRLGNQRYPHMKLVIERARDGRGYFFAADTHDRHFCLPPGTPDEEKLTVLRRENARIVATIDAAWEEESIPTFKGYLRRDLERRRSTAHPRSTG